MNYFVKVDFHGTYHALWVYDGWPRAEVCLGHRIAIKYCKEFL